MVMAFAWLLMVTSVLVALAVGVAWVRLMVFCSREGRRDQAVPLTVLVAARRRAVTAARHAALPAVEVVSVTAVTDRKALP